MSETLPRVRAGQPVADDGSCWRHIAERQQAIMERDTVPGYTAGAVEAMDAGDPKPSAGYCDGYSAGWADALGGPPPMSSPWLLFVAGVMCGAVACA